MKTINLLGAKRGEVALVDDEDYEKCLNFSRWCLSPYGYAIARPRINGKLRGFMLHKFVLGYEGDLEVDHKDGNRLNCQKGNLRIATPQQNKMNATRHSDNTTGIKGVKFCKRAGKFKAYININGKQIHLGSFDNLEDASVARKKAAATTYKEFYTERGDLL
jgi:hypothetical protein